MIYSIIQTNQPSQVLLVSEEKRGNNPVISVQLPDDKANQIVKALYLVERIADLSDKNIELILTLNLKETLVALRREAKQILNK